MYFYCFYYQSLPYIVLCGKKNISFIIFPFAGSVAHYSQTRWRHRPFGHKPLLGS